MNKVTEHAVDAFELDDFHFRLECGIDMLDIIRSGLESEVYSSKVVDNVLSGVVLYLTGLRDELRQIVKQAIKGEK
ncbi:MAG: hypothetical protein ACLU8W_10875 [Clostridia bacterium]